MRLAMLADTRRSEVSLKKLLVAAVVLVLVVVAAAIPALALNTQAWEERRIATEAFDAAADLARSASDDAEAAHAGLVEARDRAELALEDARVVLASGPGYLTGTLVTELQTAVTTLDEALAAEVPDGLAMPPIERPESIADLSAGVAPLTAWAADEKVRAATIVQLAASLGAATIAAHFSAVAAAESVTPEAAAALGAAPLASAESRTAVESARDAVLKAIKNEASLGESVGAYASAVAALRASQQAAADAAAADAAASAEGERDTSLLVPFTPPPFCLPSLDGMGWDCMD